MKAFIALFIILFQFSLHAQDAVIAVGEAEVEKDKLVIDDPEMKSMNSDQKKIASDLMDLLRNNFIFYKHKFNTVDYSDKGKSSYSNPNLDKWKENDVAYFISSQISGNFSGIGVRYKVWSVLTGKEIFSDSFKLNESELRAKVP